MKLPGDVGFRFIHQNEYFSPGAPLRPLLRAVYTHRPDFNIKEYDFVMDRNNLIKLFRFIYGGSGPPIVGNASPPEEPKSPQTPPISPSSSPPGGTGSWRDRHPASAGEGLRGRSLRGNTGLGYNSDRGRGSSAGRGRGGGRYVRGVWSPNFQYKPPPPQDTRIDVDIMGGEDGTGKSSMLMSRWDTHSSEMVAAEDFKGWGYQFMAAFTKFGDAGEDAVMDGGEAQSHHRVISYEFGGYKFLVRYHADAVQESLGELRWWAEKNRKEQLALKKVAEAVEKTKGRYASSRSPGKRADDWLEKEFAEGLSKMNLNGIRATSK